MNTQELIKILVCPKCHSKLMFAEKAGASGFICETCEVVYPVKDDIPIMLVEKAIPKASWLDNCGDKQCVS